MEISDLIGYVVTALALFYFMGMKQRPQEPEEEPQDDDQAQKLKEFLRSIDMDMQEKPAVPVKKVKALPPKAIKKKVEAAIPHKIRDGSFYSIADRKFETAIDERRLKTSIVSSYEDPYKDKVIAAGIGDAPDYNVIGRKGGSRAEQLLSDLRSKKQMVLLHEIFGPPKGL